MNSNYNLEKRLFEAVASLGMAIWLLYLSNLYKLQGGHISLMLFMYPQNIVFMIFGIVQGFNIWSIQQKIYDDIPIVSAVYFLANSFLYMAFYSLVLFPLSGIGLLEWLLVAFILFSDFYSKINIKRRNAMGQHPIAVLLFGLCLFLIKVFVWYFFPNNIYQTSVVGNNMLRILISIIAVMGIIFLLSQLKNRFTSRKKLKGFAKLRKIFSLLFSFAALPILLAVLLIAGFLIILSVSSILTDIKTDINNFLAPYLEQMLKTGKNTVPITNYYILCQLVSFFVIIVYQILAFYLGLQKVAREKALIVFKIEDGTDNDLNSLIQENPLPLILYEEKYKAEYLIRKKKQKVKELVE